MAVFDPTVIGIQGGGGPSMGGAPDTLSPFAAGSAMGHLAAAFSAKRDSNAHNRGLAAAHDHITLARPDIENYKLKHILEPDFDSGYMQVLNDSITKQKDKAQYSPQSEAEQLAYENALSTFKGQEFHAGYVQSAKAVHEHNLGLLQKNVEHYKNQLVAAPTDIEAGMAAENLFIAYREASRMDRKNPGVISPEQALERFETDMRTSAVMRRMEHLSPQELFEFGHDSIASVDIPAATIEHFLKGEIPTETKSIPVTGKEREGIIAYALERQKHMLTLDENARKYTSNKVLLQRTSLEREFYDGVIESGGVAGPTLLKKLQNAYRDDGLPMFDGGDIAKFQSFIHTETENAKKPPIVSDPTTFDRYYKQIFPDNRDGGIDYSSFPLPDPLVIMADTKLSSSDRQALVNHVTSVKQMRTNRDFSDFAKRDSMGEELLKAAVGGQAMIEISPVTRNIYGTLLNSYRARVQQRYREAVEAGNGLRAIDPQAIVNQLIEEGTPAMTSIYFREIETQAKALSLYIARVPSSVPDTAPVTAVLEYIRQDMDEPDTVPNRKGRLPVNEGVRLMQVLRAVEQNGKTLGDLRQALTDDSIKFDPTKKTIETDSWFYRLFQGGLGKGK